MNVQYTRLSMTPSGVLPVVYMSQYDIGRPIGFICDEDLDSYTVTLEATRTDGTAITAAITTDGEIGTFETTATMTNVADEYIAQVVIVDSDENRVASIPVRMVVIKAAMDENAEAIEEDASLYQQYTATVQANIAQVAATVQSNIEQITADITDLSNVSDVFRGKHLLIVGDSWTAGYNGSGSTVGWTPTFINLLGCTADVDYESGAGFIKVSQENGALHPGETLVNVLDHYRNIDYYAIIVQSGVNDIHYSSSESDLASGIANFASKCRSYWPNAKIIYFPTYAQHYIAVAKQRYATILVNSAANAGMDVCKHSLNWALFGDDSVKGADDSHLSLDGYVQLGKWAAAYCSGWNGDPIARDITYQSNGQKQSYAFNVAWETAGNVHPTYSKTLYVRANGDTVGILASFVVNTSATSGSIAIITGLPIEKTSGGIFMEARVASVSVIAPRAYVSGGTLYLEIFGGQNLNSVRVQVTGHYHSRQNAF